VLCYYLQQARAFCFKSQLSISSVHAQVLQISFMMEASLKHVQELRRVLNISVLQSSWLELWMTIFLLTKVSLNNSELSAVSNC
jgi:hypothetical protein